MYTKVFDTKLECTDWRSGASIYGLVKFFEAEGIDYQKDDEYLYFNKEDIVEEKYLHFVEEYYQEDMLHKKVENILFYSEFSDEQIKAVNDALVGNTIMKKVFGKTRFDGTNKEQILKIIEDNRQEIIKETFRNKKNLYANFCNTTLLGAEEQPHCRLVGYNVDENRKSKSVAYAFDANSFVGTDRLEYDFIPVAFTNTYDSFFINNNMNIETLIQTNNELKIAIKESQKEKETRVTPMEILFQEMIKSGEFLDYDVEIIKKSRDKSFFETLYIRKDAVRKLKELKNLNGINFSVKITDEYYINIGEEVINRILNDQIVDSLIYLLLKEEQKRKKGGFSYYLSIKKLIRVNRLIKKKKEEDLVTGEMKGAYKRAIECTGKLKEQNKENKIRSYKQKLISAMVAEDYDRVNIVMLQLSEFSGVAFPFMYNLFEDFEGNKEIALTFINTLGYEGKENKEVKEGE